MELFRRQVDLFIGTKPARAIASTEAHGRPYVRIGCIFENILGERFVIAVDDRVRNRRAILVLNRFSIPGRVDPFFRKHHTSADAPWKEILVLTEKYERAFMLDDGQITINVPILPPIGQVPLRKIDLAVLKIVDAVKVVKP